MSDLDKIDVVDRYLALSDQAPHDPRAFDEMINLFAEDAVVELIGTPIRGRANLATLYRELYGAIAAGRHHWTSEQLPDGTIKVIWSVSMRLTNGTIHAAAGTEHATVDDHGLITHLRNEPAGQLSVGGPEHTNS